MPASPLFDVADLDLSQVQVSREQVYEILPQRHEFMVLDGILHFDAAARRVVAFKDIRTDDWWARGHLPGRPLLPGVLMIEAAAQVAAYCSHMLNATDRFLGFTGVDNVKFRGIVQPPCRLLLLGHAASVKPKRVICDAQGWVGNKLVFEGTVTGMPV